MENFTPVSGLIGGALIGLSAGALLLFNGDILGASGLMSSFVVAPKKTLTDPSQQWKLFFVIAFFVATRIYLVIDPTALDETRTGPGIHIVSPLGFLLGGFLVGFGTRLGNGCTTGHGICGLARLSVRSLVGVISFMTTGMLFASLCPEPNTHIRDQDSTPEKLQTTVATNIAILSIMAIIAIFALIGRINAFYREDLPNDRRKLMPSVFAAILFAVGLMVSQMTLYSKIFGFLNLTLIPQGAWDPTLVMVMGGALIFSFISYQWVAGFNMIPNSKALECPLSQGTDGHFNVPSNKTIDIKLILGEAIFGLGWGMAGLCPGPAMVRAAIGDQYVLLRWWPMFFLGSFLAEKVKLLLSHRSQSKSDADPVGSSKVASTQKTFNEEDTGDEEAAIEIPQPEVL